jgi:serine protease
MPYVADAGSGCGAGFVATGSSGVAGNSEGVTIVGGHEYAETLTDPAPSSGWVDSTGAETGDKCAWISSGQGASAIVGMNGSNYAVQSLWSNNFNNDSGGCVISYTSASNQH